MQRAVDAQLPTVAPSGCRQDIGRYRDVAVSALLLGGSESSAAFGGALDVLQAVLPVVERTTLTGESHAAHLSSPGQLADIVASFAERTNTLSHRACHHDNRRIPVRRRGTGPVRTARLPAVEDATSRAGRRRYQ